MSKIKVEKTSNLNGRKLWQMSRKFMVPPIIIRDLQKGFIEEMEEHAAKAMIVAGLVKRVAETKPNKLKTDKPKSKKSKKAETVIEAIGDVDNVKTVVDEPDSSVVNDGFSSDTEDNKDDDEDMLSRKDTEL